MTLIEQISADFMTAYKNKEMEKKDFLGLTKSTLTKDTKTPTDAEVVAGLKNLIKKHNESLEKYGEGTMSELELGIVDGYIPKQMTEGELTEVITAFASEKGLSGPKAVGPIMGYLKNNYAGQYDGKMASTIAKGLA